MTADVNPTGEGGTLRQAQTALTEQRIVAAATELFLADGYVATTLEAVARRARVAARTVYVRFGTKAALFKRVVDVAIVGDTEQVDVLINGVRLGPQPTPLLHGDKVQIGNTELLFVDERRSGSTHYVAAVLTLIAFVLIVAAYVPGTRIKSWLHHPMVLGVKVWAFAHLISNGTLADVVLFGSFLVWAIAAFASSRRRDRAAGTAMPPASVTARSSASAAQSTGKVMRAWRREGGCRVRAAARPR